MASFIPYQCLFNPSSHVYGPATLGCKADEAPAPREREKNRMETK